MKMRQIALILPVAAMLAFAAAAPVSAASADKYQVTGPVLELTDTTIVVQKGTQRWELARDASTKITGELKVGAKVTIEYRMTATTVVVKPATAPKAKAK